MGGLIAFEIAQQLLQSGETVELLALLDTQLDELVPNVPGLAFTPGGPCRDRTPRDPRSFLARARRLHSCESRPFRRQASRDRWKNGQSTPASTSKSSEVCSVYRRANGGSFWLCGSPWPHIAQRRTLAVALYLTCRLQRFAVLNLSFSVNK